jgi:hypothetical protein
MSFIKLNYLYRDYGNYKEYGFVVFRNPNNLSIEKVETEIRNRLLDETWFLHFQWNLPDLHFEKTDFEQDHPFHEFESLEAIADVENPIDSAIEEFLQQIKKSDYVN